jgi:group I intron endonuclease
MLNVDSFCKNKSGIYKISFEDKCYIGSSVNLYNRLHRHKCDLNKDKHHSEYMQNVYNKHGENFFKIEILEYVERNIQKLREKEEQYLKFIKCVFNSTTPITYNHSISMRKKISLTMKKKWLENPELNPRLNKGHKLWVYDYTGNLLYSDKKPEDLVKLLKYSNRAVFNGAIRNSRPIIDKKYLVLLDNNWELLYDYIKMKKGLYIPLYKIFKNGKITECNAISTFRVLSKVLQSKDFTYYSKKLNCFYTFIGLIDKCRLREEIPQIITAELSKEGEIPNLN